MDRKKLKDPEDIKNWKFLSLEPKLPVTYHFTEDSPVTVQNVLFELFWDEGEVDMYGILEMLRAKSKKEGGIRPLEILEHAKHKNRILIITTSSYFDINNGGQTLFYWQNATDRVDMRNPMNLS